MLKAAIEKIQALCAPHLFTVDGESFLADKDGKAVQIRPALDLVQSIDLSSLDAMILFIKTEASEDREMVYITIPDHKTVKSFTHPYENLRNEREYL